MRTIDYLSFTIKDYTHYEEILNRLYYKFLPRGYGGKGYLLGFQADVPGITVLAGGKVEQMGTHVQISGEGCRMLEACPDFPGWPEFMKIWRANGANFTRIDLAMDDLEAQVSYKDVLSWEESGVLVRKGNSIRQYGNRVQGKQAWTLYIGSRQSEVMLRVYQKGWELTQKGLSLPEGAHPDFLRFECEYKGRRADQVAQVIINQGLQAAFGCIRHSFEFTNPDDIDKRSNKRRAAEWWVHLVEHTKIVTTVTQYVQKSLEQVKNWITKQVGTSLATIVHADGGSIQFLVDVIKASEQRLKPRHRIMISGALCMPT